MLQPASLTLLLTMASVGWAADEFYTLATRWPRSACEAYKDGSQCYIADNITSWTVHGVWPDRYDGSRPEYCDGPEFDPDLLQPFLAALLQLWPNVYADDTAEDFWKHEWDKHGKCAVASGFVADQTDYFSFGITEVIRYNGFQILVKGGIIPSDQPQNLTSILNVIDDTLYYRFVVTCDYQEQQKRQLLKGLQVCFDPDQKAVDCYIDDDHTSYHTEDCDLNQPVYYPPLR